MTRSTSRNKLLLTITVILIFSFVGVSGLNYMITRASVSEEILQNDLPLTMDNIYSELTSEMMRPLLLSSLMASDTFLKNWALEGEKDAENVIDYLNEIKEKYGFFTTFFVSAETNIYYRFNGIHKTVSPSDSHDVWFYDFLRQDSEYQLDVDHDEAARNRLTIFINYKVLSSEGKLLGVTGVGLQMDKVAQLVSHVQEKYHRAVYLTDRNGLIQVHPDISYIEKKSINDQEGIGPLAGSILNTKKDPANFQFERAGEHIFLTVRYIDSFSWLLYVEQNETEALVTAKNNFIRTVGLGLVASGFIVFLTLITVDNYQKKLEQFAVSDELTGAANRRKLESEFKRALYGYSRSSELFSLILMDLDGFKKVNDTRGHLAGDMVLIKFSALIKSIIRPTDVFARWGGDEFTVLCFGGIEDSGVLAERIRQTVESAPLVGEENGLDDLVNPVTLSCGVTVFRQGDDMDSMLLRADRGLYRCKKRGGNCVEVDDA